MDFKLGPAAESYAEARRRLPKEKVVPLKSTALGQVIYLVLGKRFKNRVPAGGVPYFLSEVKLLEGVTPEELRFIHEVKKTFGGQLVDESAGSF